MLVLQAIGYLSRRTSLEGMFRISTTHNHLIELKKLFTSSSDAIALEMHTTDPHAVASLLKLFLRELPVPVITPPVFKDMVSLSLSLSLSLSVCLSLSHG
jgi:RalA-binding protein 1